MSETIQVRVEVLGKKIPISVLPDDELFVRGVVACVNEMDARTREVDALAENDNSVYFTLLLMGEHIVNLRNVKAELEVEILGLQDAAQYGQMEREDLKKEIELLKKQVLDLQMQNASLHENKVLLPPQDKTEG